MATAALRTRSFSSLGRANAAVRRIAIPPSSLQCVPSRPGPRSFDPTVSVRIRIPSLAVFRGGLSFSSTSSSGSDPKQREQEQRPVSPYGRLWGKDHETFESRRILSVTGSGATKYLQGLVTCDLMNEPRAPRKQPEAESWENIPEVPFTSLLRATCFLDQKGRILTDALLWKRTWNDKEETAESSNVEYLIDVPGDTADTLLHHLKKYKLRRSMVTISDKSDVISSHVLFGTLNADGAPPGYLSAMDPRHPSLGMRTLCFGDEGVPLEERRSRFVNMISSFFPPAPGTYDVVRKLAGVAEGSEIAGKTALECNQEFLNAVSFSKGCYLGQELTARSQYTGVVRKRVLPLIIMDTETQIPRPWVLASSIQDCGLDSLNPEMLREKLGVEIDFDGYEPAALPQLSVNGAGAMVSVIAGAGMSIMEEAQRLAVDKGEDVAKEELKSQKQLEVAQEQADRLTAEIEKVATAGTKIIDKADGKMIGQVISVIPATGTTVVLAQMRLDRVGLMEPLGGAPAPTASTTDGKSHEFSSLARTTGWSRTNRILFAREDDSDADNEKKKEYRYLPYLPLWWPPLDRKSGKEKVPHDESTEEEKQQS